jgi:hypothetical protein
MTSFTLRHNGDLDVVWFTPRKKTESKRIVKHVPAPVASTIGVAERMLDKRLEYDHGEMYLKRDTTPKQYFESHPEPLEVKVPFEDLGKAQQDRLVAEHGGVQNVPFDLFRIDNMADRVAFRKCQYMRMLHTEKAVQERVQENKAKHTPAYLMNYNSKIKYSSFTGTAHQDIRPLHAKIAELREEKGCCAWPNGYNKTV